MVQKINLKKTVLQNNHLFSYLALNTFYWYFSIKKIKVSVSSYISENFKVPMPIP